MFQASLRYGIQKATKIEVEATSGATVGEQIEALLEHTEDEHVAGQIRRALADPRCTIEVKSGKSVQTATPDMPLRELLPHETEDVQITVSQPHAGG